MRSRRSLNNFLSKDRKTLYAILSILLVSAFTLTVVYAALSTTLNITGTAQVTAASWDIYLDNVQLNSNNATTALPTISNKTTTSFTTTLTNPGDFYEFTIDVINNGSIDAMIDSVTITPELSAEQAKYINYIVEYQNGESINTKQLVEKNSFVRLKIKVEYRKDISSSELPTQSETLNLAFRVNYVQSDDSDENIAIDNNGKLIKIVSGDGTNAGDEICIGSECFYVISSDEDSITMLSKYNLYVGGKYENGTWTAYGDEATGIQDSTMLGWESGESVYKGTIVFSSTNYWYSGGLKVEYGTRYPTYVYDSNSSIHNYVEDYKTYLESQGAKIEEARLIKMEELETLGCISDDFSCTDAPTWVYIASYWSGSAIDNDSAWAVGSNGVFGDNHYDSRGGYGVRPVITISKS